jgi:ribosomal protein L37AE/L43A
MFNQENIDANKKVRLLKLDEEGNRHYRCPVCDVGLVKIRDDLFYGRCDNCNATLIDYIPLLHQEAFHKSNAQYRLNIGG